MVSKVRSKLKDIARFLEEAGFVEAANNVQMAMDALDGAFDDDLNDGIIANTPDVQLNLPGSGDYMMTGEVAGGMQGAFSIPEAEKLASLANRLDKLGMYDEADAIDDIIEDIISGQTPEITEELDKGKHDIKKKRTDNDKKDKAGIGTLVDSNGHVGTGVTDNQNAGSFQGFSDAYFFSGYGNLEGAYGPSDR